jgi:glycosyltransferase involved in cell wall biosynthesis
MCAGLPVIYTNYSSHAEFLGRGRAGLPVGGLLQPEADTCIWRMVADVGQVVEAVRRLYFDRALGRTLGENGRNFVQEFTPPVQAERWHAIFELLREKPAATVVPRA